MSTAGLVLGITVMVFGFVFYDALFLFLVVGLPLSVAGFYRAQKDGTSLIIPIASLAINSGGTMLFLLQVLAGIILFFYPIQF